MNPSLLTEAVATTPGISAQVAMLAVQRSNKSWHGFIGQSKIVTRIKSHIAGAKRVNSQIGTVLLLGTSGSGKSALALSMAKEIGTKCVKVIGNPKYTVKELEKVTAGLATGDVLFLDEAHSLSMPVQERLMALLECMQPSETKKVPHFNVVLATDQPGQLVQALERRMSVRIQVGFYSPEELVDICGQFARNIRVSISAQGRGLLCKYCRGEPRQIRHLVEGMKRFYSGTSQATKDDVREFLDSEGYDEHGNNDTERKYLNVLLSSSTMALPKLASLVGVDALYIQRRIEPRMLELGWIDIGAGGRTLTEAGKKVTTSCLLETSTM